MKLPLPPIEKFRELEAETAPLNEQIDQMRSKVVEAIAIGKPILIVGPCSIHNLESDLTLAEKIATLQKLYPNILFVFRAHLEKPRSSHFWRGFLLDPDLDNSCNLLKGVRQGRAFLKQIAELSLPVSCEFIDPLLAPYIEDLISVGVIGARTVYSQTHRQLAASLPMPILFKNSLDGGLEGALDAIQVVRNGLYIPKLTKKGVEVIWAQNAQAHLVLRGGFSGSNLHLGKEACKLLDPQTKVFIDCAHQNAQKDPIKQAENFANWLNAPKSAGCMVECNLIAGTQPFSSEPQPGLSITDPCVGIETLETLLSQHVSHQCVSTS